MRISAAASSFLLAFSTSRAFAFAPATAMASRTAAAAASSLSVSKGDTIEFAKYEGLGNDFILIDDRDKSAPSLTPEQSERLCNRNFGIGGDGVIFALKPNAIEGSPEVEGGYDFTMRIYNSDGSEPEMCGNGIRCFAAFLRDLGADGEFCVLLLFDFAKMLPCQLGIKKCICSYVEFVGLYQFWFYITNPAITFIC